MLNSWELLQLVCTTDLAGVPQLPSRLFATQYGQIGSHFFLMWPAPTSPPSVAWWRGPGWPAQARVSWTRRNPPKRVPRHPHLRLTSKFSPPAALGHAFTFVSCVLLAPFQRHGSKQKFVIRYVMMHCHQWIKESDIPVHNSGGLFPTSRQRCAS